MTHKNKITIVETAYKQNLTDDGWIELNPNPAGIGSVESISELKKEVSEDHKTIIVSTEISENNLREFSQINSTFDDVSLARIENRFFIFGKKENKRFREYFEKDISESLETTLNLETEHLKKTRAEYEELIKKVYVEKKKVEKGKSPKLKPLDNLFKKNEWILPLLRQDEMRLKYLKELSRKERHNGVFNSLLREIDYNKLYGLKTAIKTSSDTANLLHQHITQQMTEKGIKEMISLERAIELLYLFIGTYYVTKLTLLLFESYRESHYPILLTLPPFIFTVLVIVFSFLFCYFILNYLSKALKDKKANDDE
ncbi:MAG: hypothetical protein A7316_05150 [Candidatus Altiarchaeales archaeon WOR_SM1_86-2]|nr:MAG: hypothetical protein A7316_05150 [Candidatus Altiarchaeales archaeon WOR_SM1_86-2]ODS41109.1 MAG: hypothetical protein A7315_07020 [Candidatus Altiarchaeales archaeon WOR_SM1_79]